MTRTLEDATTPKGGTLEIDETWLQGRGAYGGLTVAACIRAIDERVADPRRHVRSVTAELPAPTTVGTAVVDVDVMRSGKHLTVARAALRQGDVVTAHVVVTLAAAREAAGAVAWREPTPPVLPPWTAIKPAPMTGRAFPAFAQHFELRAARGFPFAGGGTQTEGWVRARNPGTARDAAYIASMIDVWYPAYLVRATAPRPLATIAYTLELVEGLAGLPDDEPFMYRGSVPVCHDGYFLETRELWGSDGRLVARNHQTFAIIT